MSIHSWQHAWKKPIHQNTKLCVDKAEALIEKGDEDRLRYACLELRMAIEHLFYDLLPRYADEVPTDMARRWQPQKVIEVLTDCDPFVQNDCKIAFGSHQSGAAVVLESKGVSKSLIKSYWHKLGSFLHASMTGAKAVGAEEIPFLRQTISALREYEESGVLANGNRSRAGEERGDGLTAEVGFDSGCQVAEDRAALQAARLADGQHPLD
ncbi:MAG TPA: hypothetical protein VMV10_17400, partial [Pirellulales bacterium]|nr:hypothetical protein [Pirellulales bacterium]